MRSERSTRFTRRPSCGTLTLTTSPTWCVKPWPGASRSCVGDSMVPKNIIMPSGYWWCEPIACLTKSSGSRLMLLMAPWPTNRKPSAPQTSRPISHWRTDSMSKCSSNSRMKGPIAQEPLLSLALPSNKALRPSKSRRLTSLPSATPTTCAKELTASTISGSGLFQFERGCRPTSLPRPTAASTGALVKISASGPMPTSRY